MKLCKLVVRKSGNPVYYGRVRFSLTAFITVNKPSFAFASGVTGWVEPKQRYMKVCKFK